MNHETNGFDFGDLGSTPISTDWGGQRGGPIDRYFIDQFMDRHRCCIKGKVLEIGGDEYMSRFGGSNVACRDILDVDPANSKATIIDDLEDGKNLASQDYDCIILTQVLVLLRQPSKALATVHRILKNRGTLLLTNPGISHISHYPQEAECWYWSLYPKALKELLENAGFSSEDIEVTTYGNLKTTVAFLAGLGQDDLNVHDYEPNDPNYPLTTAAKVVKSETMLGKIFPQMATAQINEENANESKVSSESQRCTFATRWEKTNLPFFSIIVTSFNKGKYIEECVNSILDQEHDSYEIIIVDDGSSDDSWSVIKSFEQRGRHVICARHPNGENLGVSSTRRLGLALSRGLYVIHLDGDDRLLPGRLRHDQEILNKYPSCTSVFSTTRYFHQDPNADTSILLEAHSMDDKISRLSNRLYGELELFLYCYYDYDSRSVLIRFSPCVGGVTTRRDIALISPWREDIVCAEDVCYFAEIMTHGEIYYSGKCLSEYRLTVDGAWYKSQKNNHEQFWQQIAKSYINRMALTVDPCVMEKAAKDLAQKLHTL